MMARHLTLGVAMALGIGGYPMVAAAMALIGADGTQAPSIAFRLGLALLVPIALFLNRARLKIHNGAFLGLLALFWVAYATRIVHDGWIEQSLVDTLHPFTVIVTMVLFVLVPMLLGLVPLDARSSRLASLIVLGVTLVTVLLLLAQSQDIIASLAGRDHARFSLERLNPITIGYVGGVLVVLSAVGAFAKRTGALRLVLGGAGAVIGLGLILISASKGPALATAASLLAFWLVPLRPTRLIIGLIFVVIGVASVFRVQGFILKQFDLDVSTRYVEAFDGDASSVDMRVIAFESAIEQFTESPVFGDALFDRVTNYYPHNLTLEAFMTTGLVGGTAYVALLGMMLLACTRLLSRGGDYAWLALLAIYFNVAAQTSGSHFSFGPPWLLLVAAITTSYALREADGETVARRRRQGRGGRPGSTRGRRAAGETSAGAALARTGS